jgi:3-hydroxyisobutyrate dehydrogenase-like beta-hydroxyacid dehydrogenase
MTIGVPGSGIVAQTLARGFLKHGYETMVGTRDTAKLAEWSGRNPKARVGSFSETVERAIERLCMLWCIPRFLHNEWTHAFKLLHQK